MFGGTDSWYILFGKASLLVLGCWWCGAILRRLPGDIHRLRHSSENVERGVIVFYWFLTMIIASLLVWYIASLIKPILEYV